MSFYYQVFKRCFDTFFLFRTISIEKQHFSAWSHSIFILASMFFDWNLLAGSTSKWLRRVLFVFLNYASVMFCALRLWNRTLLLWMWILFKSFTKAINGFACLFKWNESQPVKVNFAESSHFRLHLKTRPDPEKYPVYVIFH